MEKNVKSGSERHRILILVETPLQLLCAYEYMRKHSGDFRFCVRKSGVGSNDQQMDSMISELNLRVHAEFTVRPGHHIDYVVAIVRGVCLISGRYDAVVRGSYFSGLQRLLSSIVLKRETVLLDDGLATVRADQIIRSRERNKYSTFSMFTLDPTAYVRCGLNEFAALVADYHCVTDPEFQAFFIGQKLVDVGVVDLAGYVKIVQYAAEDAGRILHYVPHRTESTRSVEAVAKVAGVFILRADVAVEYFILRNRWYPKKLYSVTSTALFTLAKMFPKSEAWALSSSALKTEMFGHYDLILEQFTRGGVVALRNVD